jgi:hypothetical protein
MRIAKAAARDCLNTRETPTKTQKKITKDCAKQQQITEIGE